MKTPVFVSSGGVIRVTGLVHPPDPTQEEMQIDLIPATSRSERGWVNYNSINMAQQSDGTFAFDAWIDKAAPPGRYRLAVYTQDASFSVLVFEGK
jgi:hypothetical protein